eukprot:3314644-Amphidinium_carterae.4
MLPEHKRQTWQKTNHTTTTTTARTTATVLPVSSTTTYLQGEWSTTRLPTYKGNGAGKQYITYNNKGAGEIAGVYNIHETTDYGYYDDNDQQQYWPEVDYLEFQQPVEKQPSPQQQLLGTPAQP